LSRLLFLNLPVRDLAASRAFFEGLGLEFSGRFCEGRAECIVIGDQAFVMLFDRERFAEFVSWPIADARAGTGFTVSITAASREEVDAITETALATGATGAKDPLEYGFMYNRTFHDLDGHLWEVMWMDRAAAVKGSDRPTTGGD